MSLQFEIIDVTLRDGSNAVNYQFSKEDTFGIVDGLQKAGINWIEVGHGLGLAASVKTKKPAKESDETYIRTAKSASGNAKIGCFYSLERATIDDMAAAREWGLDFIRIGPNADIKDVQASLNVIEAGKKLGLTVHICMRKAYAVAPKAFAQLCKPLEEAGADHVIIMDSAGNLLPNQAKEYVYALKDKLSGGVGMKVGYHAHDNLTLATACSLAAIEAGADSVDTCLKGLGRSAGNAPTEAVLAALKRMGYDKGNLYAIQDLGDKYIGKKAYETLSSISLIFGMAGFHSAFFAKAKSIAEEFQIDPRILVTKSCEVDMINPSEQLFRELAAEIKRGANE